MVLMDEKGTKMPAMCLKEFLCGFEKFLFENDCLLIHKPTLAKSGSNQNWYNSTQKISFYHNTRVKKCTDFTGSLYGFVFTDFKQVEEKKLSINSQVDVIGYVLKCYNVENTVNKFGKDSKRLNLLLKDLNDVELNVTLWDAYADQMASYLEDKKGSDGTMHLFLIIQFGIITNNRGIGQKVSNSYDVTRLFINSDIEEINTFKQQFLGKPSNVSLSDQQGLCSLMSTSIEDVFLKKNEFSTIADLSIISMVKSVIIIGTIMGVSRDKPWYYLACSSCNRKVQIKFNYLEKEDGTLDVETEKVYQCNNAKCINGEISAVPRFKIPIRVQDNTGVVSLTLWDREAFKLIRKSARELVQRKEQLGENDDLPQEFDQMVEKNYAFQIQITEYNLNTGVQGFAINKLTDDVFILGELQKKFENYQDDLDDPVVVAAQSEVPSNSTVTFKDDVSATGENDTPVSAVIEVNGRAKSVEKRSLKDVFDADESEGCSATKPRFKTQKSKVTTGNGTKELIIPKMEK